MDTVKNPIIITSKDSPDIFINNYYELVKHDIRNCKILSESQLEYIKKIPNNLKNELLVIYNECMITINEILE